jgi:hypothetical protein
MNDEIRNFLLEGEYSKACELIKQSLNNGIDFQGFHIQYAHTLLSNSDWAEITSLLPRETNCLLTSGWLNSIIQGRPINANNEPIPWITYPAIDFLDSIVRTDWKVFEWGSGNSTRWWANKVEQVCAVESNLDWFNEVKVSLPSNASLLNYSSEENYTQAINSFDNSSFDAIVIDGDFRNQCARACITKLKPHGIIIFDNTDGIEFNDGVLAIQEQGFYRMDFWGLIPSYIYKNCTSIFFRDLKVFESNRSLPSQHTSSVGISCYQAIDKYQILE